MLIYYVIYFNLNGFIFNNIFNNEEGRIIIELFENIAPKTCKNFKALCTGK